MNILIIDEQVFFAEGLKNFLQTNDDLKKVEFVNDVDKGIAYIQDNGIPDLILLSINDQATANSYDFITRLHNENLDIPVLVNSAYDSPEAAGSAIENNASGFITKNCGRKTTLNAILSVLDGNLYIRKPKQKKAHETEAQSYGRVTSRQKEVLYLLSQGLLNKQIAHEMNISANTVKAHLHDLFGKLQVTNRTAAVQNAHKYGLI